MSASTAPSGSLARLEPLRARLTPASVRPTVTNGRIYGLLALASLALGALSLLFPSTPTYDPWSWIIWGREIAHFDLLTTSGPSWKPLPVIFTTIFSLFGGIAPDLWLIVARAGAVMAVVLAFKLAARLVGRPSPASVAAGLIAASALLLSPNFARTLALGNSEGLLVAFALWGVERHLDGRYRQAFVLGFLAALLRPEVWPFLGVYALWLVLIDRDAWKLVVGGFVLIGALWFLPEWWGSGNLWRAADRAQRPNPNSPAFAKHPFIKVLQNTRPLILTPAKLGALLAVGFVAVDWARGRRRVAVPAVLALGLAWIVLIAAMTQAGFSGNPRYIILGVALIAVVAGYGCGRLIELAIEAVRGSFGATSPATAAAVGVLGVAVIFGGSLHWTLPRFKGLFNGVNSTLRYQAQLRFDLEDVLAKAGGAKKVASCGRAATGMYQVPMVAWYLHEHIRQVWMDPPKSGPGIIIRSRATRGDRLAPFQPYPPAFRQAVQVRTTTLFSTCTGAPGA